MERPRRWSEKTSQRLTHEVDPQHADAHSGQFAEVVAALLPGAVGEAALHQRGGTAGHGNGQAVAEAEQDDEHQPGEDLLLHGDDGEDRLSGGLGDDHLHGGNGRDDLFGDGGNDDLSGNDGDDRLFGGLGNDQLRGGIGFDELHGDSGDDLLVGDDGEDRLFGDVGRDTLNGGANDDRLFGGRGDDILRGDDGNDRLLGEDGNDSLFGGDGADFLKGAKGNDNLTGGLGPDVFDFSMSIGSRNGTDTIMDFSLLETDKLSFSDVRNAGGSSVVDINDLLAWTSVTNKAGEAQLNLFSDLANTKSIGHVVLSGIAFHSGSPSDEINAYIDNAHIILSIS